MKTLKQIINSKKNLNKINTTAILVLENGTCFNGFGLGYEGTVTGEVCFNTSITIIKKLSLTPLILIKLLILHSLTLEMSERIKMTMKLKAWVKGVILNTEITEPSNYRSIKNLNKWLKENKIVGLTGLDTRALTSYIRNEGAPKGTISFLKSGKHNIKNLQLKSKKWSGLKGLDLASKVSCKKIYKWSSLKTWEKTKGYIKNKKFKYKVVAIDYGMKENILRCLSDLSCKVTVVPAKTNIKTILSLNRMEFFCLMDLVILRQLESMPYRL